MSGVFTISLDFELHWGGFEKWPLELYKHYFLNTRRVIPEMLTMFLEGDVHVTWATVGLLFHESRASLLQNAPALKPAYEFSRLSAYNFIERRGIGNNEYDDPFHFGSSLINKIIAT